MAELIAVLVKAIESNPQAVIGIVQTILDLCKADPTMLVDLVNAMKK